MSLTRSTPTGRASEMGESTEAETIAIQGFEGEYGKVSTIYGEDTSTLGAWAEAEPNNTSGLDTSDPNSDSMVVALFITGDFTVTGPYSFKLGGPVIREFSAGRIVFDDAGKLRNIQLWSEAKPSTPALGSDFDDK